MQLHWRFLIKKQALSKAFLLLKQIFPHTHIALITGFAKLYWIADWEAYRLFCKTRTQILLLAVPTSKVSAVLQHIWYYKSMSTYWEVYMRISYKKLWKLLIDKDMRKLDLQWVAGISSTSVAKLAKSENVNTDILVKICKALECDTSDIMAIETTKQGDVNASK